MSLTLLEPKAVLDLLDMFLGNRPPLAPGEGANLAQPPYGTYVSWLKDDAGVVQGAVLTDLAASLYIGGGLIMMPQASLNEMLASGTPSDAVLDGLAEVFNNVRGQLNRIDGNPHVSPTDPEPYMPPAPGSDAAWVLNPASRIDLRGPTAFGPATVTLLSR